MTDPRADDGRSGGEIVAYESPDGADALHVRMEHETLWLTQRQMADAFDTTRQNVSMHLKAVFADGELDRRATTKDFLLVRSEGRRTVRRSLTHYNLDAIISVGYRVDSKRAVRFRQWADRALLDQALRTARRKAVREIVDRYADTWRLLVEYDEDRLGSPPGTRPPTVALHHDRASRAIADFKAALIERGEASELFGIPRGDAFADILDRVERQAVSGEPLYGTREGKAANLLYSLVKDRPFTEGSKRIGALLFLLYLGQEGLDHALNPRALTVLTLLIAQSPPQNEDLLVGLVVSLLAVPPR